MKRILTMVLALVLLCGTVIGFTSCGVNSAEDWERVQEKGKFVCGITLYEPMNYKNASGELVGFDTDFAKAVAEYLGVEVEFKVIDWPNKYMELNSGKIDLIWNGYTYGDETDGLSRTEYVDFTYSYLENRQCLVTKTARLDELSSATALVGKKAAVEADSAGEGEAKELAGDTGKISKFTSQLDALLELEAGRVDFVILDYQLAKAMVGVGDYADLSINEAVTFEPEVYAIGCRKGSSLTAKINEAMVALSEDGTLEAIAVEYGLTNDLIADIGADK